MERSLRIQQPYFRPIYCSSFLAPIQCSTWKSYGGLVKRISICRHTSDTRRSQAALQAFEIDGDFEGVMEPEDAIKYIKGRLQTMDDGRITVSPYDTAWVALIANANHGHNQTPHFPSSLNWIATNQLSDGSWGDSREFSAYDRLLCTLACVVALETWKVHPTKAERGIIFIIENMPKLEHADEENMTCGFELVFPALLEKARNLGIQLPYDSPVLKQIYSRRDLKLARIPREEMHTVHTSLLYSLEGIVHDLDWEKLLKLQTPPGSFLGSPASTAFAVMETKDENCLRYLENIVSKYNGGVPNLFPIDLFPRLWAVDRLQRLGISHYFSSEIDECLRYVNRHWNKNGIYFVRDSVFCDIDDTCMGFMLLRRHGYNVTPDVLKRFKNGDQFCCLPGQINETPTPIFNLYRASQVLFPGETILEDAKKFSYTYLKERLDNNKLSDKWVIPKDFVGEVRYGLEVPWYASLPRIEARFFIEQYGGANDVWIGKILYRMPDINNNLYLELARSDFNKCQTQHQAEWKNLVKWYEEFNLQGFGISRKILLLAYFLATANIFEPTKMIERRAWAKTVVISRAIRSFLRQEQYISLISEFNNSLNEPPITNGNNTFKSSLLSILLEFLQQLSQDSFEQLGKDIHHQLHAAWQMWLNGLNKEEVLGFKGEPELIVRTLNLCSGSIDSFDIFSEIEYKRLTHLTNKICHKLENQQNEKGVQVHSMEHSDVNTSKDMDIEADFQELVQLVLQNSSDGISQDIKQTFLAVTKTFYYTTYCSPKTVDIHISKLLFKPVL